MNKIFFITGACASGKTMALTGIQERYLDAFHYCYYDTLLDVPSDEEVYKKYGNWDGWHRHLTQEWVKKIKREFITTKHVLIDGQSRPDFIEEACAEEQVPFDIILLECSFEDRKKRLIDRSEPHIIAPTLDPWVRFLHAECANRGCLIIDNSHLKPEETQLIILDHVRRSISSSPKTRNKKPVGFL